MIRPDKRQNALYALQGLLIKARDLVHSSASGKEVAGILDYAEDIPRLLAVESDETERLRAIFSEVATRFQCPFVLSRFDDPSPKEW